MAKFGRLSKLSIDGKTFPFELPEAHVPAFCERVPVVHLAHMGRANPDYFNARMVLSANGMTKAGKRSQQEIEETAIREAVSLDRDRELMPAYVIKGWSDMYDDQGNEVAFSSVEADDLLKQLPDDIIDRMRTKAMDIGNYRDVLALEPAGEAALSGN